MSDVWKQFERDVRDILGLDMTMRQWATTSGVPQPDGDLVTAGTWLDGLHIEVKRRQTLCIPQWVRETEAAADGDWLLVAKRKGKGAAGKAYAITDLATITRWLRLARGEDRMKQVLTEDELATELNVTVQTIRRWRVERGLPFIRVSQNVLRFNRDSVLAWLDDQEERSA